MTHWHRIVTVDEVKRRAIWPRLANMHATFGSHYRTGAVRIPKVSLALWEPGLRKGWRSLA